MKSKLLLITALSLCAAVSISATRVSTVSNIESKITGDYVEARTAAVFAGACHYNGELVTVGKDAVMAWSFAGGSYNGVDLSGVRAVAAVTSDANLGEKHGLRKSELAVDPRATDQQVAALVSLLQSKLGPQLGQIASIRRTPIAFSHTTDGYTVNANGFATMSVQSLPNDACCKMASDVWYAPLSPIQGRKVGYTESAGVTWTLADPWQRTAENSAFYGPIAF